MNTTPIDHKIYGIVWDDKFKHFVNPSDIRINPSNGEMHGRLSAGNVEEWGFMQLTALRSINDEPIYNHMIVKNEFGDHFLVDMFNYPIMEFLTRFDLEIIGNSFQHPELLEMCK